MKQITGSIIKWSFLATYIIILFIYITKSIQPELYYHLQQPPFISDWNFFSTFLIYPGGISQYIANFLSQFFFYGWAGSFVILFICLLIMFTGRSIFKSYKASDSAYFWMFIPVILFIAVINNYYFPFVVAIKVMFVYVAIWVFSYLQKKDLNAYLAFSVMALLIYYIAGSGTLMIYSASVLISRFIVTDNIKKSFVFLIFGLIYSYLIALVSYKYIFDIAPDEAYFSLLPNMSNFMRYKPEILYKIFYFSLPLIALIIFLYQTALFKLFKKGIVTIKNGQPVIILISYIFTGVVIAGISYFTIKSTVDSHKKNIILADYYCYNEQWEKAIDIALSDHTYDIFINLNYNRAIDNNGHYLDAFFNYPQLMGTDAIYPDKINAPELSEICIDYYFDLGYISESQHWAYEALTIFPYSIRVLKRLVITNLIYKNYSGASEYLAILNKNFLAKDFVEKYQPYVNDTSFAFKDNLILDKRTLMPEMVHLSNDINNRFLDLIDKSAKNRKAYEHLQICAMLDQNLGLFMSKLPAAGRFYNKLPQLYEQAIMMFLYISKSKNINQYKLSLNSRRTFMGFLKILKDNNNNSEFAKPALESYSGTYMYYVTYNSPIVTKAILTKQNEQNY